MNIPHQHAFAIALSLAATAFALPAAAQSKGDWAIGVGAHQVAPKGNNGRLVNDTLKLDVGNDARPTVTFEYFIADNLGVEVLGALPFEHDIRLQGLGKVGSTKHLPPVVSLQYHFTNSSRFTPLVGLGINYTAFFSTDTTGALANSKLDLENSWGLAARVGLDVAIDERSAIRFDARWIDIDSKVKLDGARIGTAHIDPLVYGAAYVWRF